MGRALTVGALAAVIVVGPGVLFSYVVPRAVWFRLFVTAGVVALTLGALRSRPRLRWADDWFAVGLFGFLAVSVVAAALGVAPTRSFFGDLERMGGVWTLLHVAGLYLLLRSYFDVGDWHWLLQLISILGGVVALTVIADWRALDILGGEARPDGILGTPGYVGGLMLLVVPLAVLAFARARSRWRVVHLVVGGLASAALLLAMTRAAILGAAVGGLVAGSWALWRHRRYLWLATLGLVLAAVLAAGVLLRATVPPEEGLRSVPLVERLVGTSIEQVPVGFRIFVWKAVPSAIEDRWLLGWGPENETQAIAAHADLTWDAGSHAGLRIDRSHNVLLDVGVTTGALGLMFYLLLWIGLLRAVLKAADRLPGVAAGLLLAGVVGHGVYLLFWFPDLTGWIALVVIGALATTTATGSPLLELRPGDRPVRRTLAVLVAVVAVALLWAQAYHPLAQARRLYLAETAPRPQDRIAQLEAALDAGATQKLQPLLRHESFLQQLFTDPQIRRNPGAIRRIVASAELGRAAAIREIERDPRNDILWGRLASYAMIRYEATNDPEALETALEAVRTAQRLAPGKIRYAHFLSQIHLAAGDTAAARRVLDRTLAWTDDFGETHVLLARTAFEAGRPREAAEALLEAGRTRWRFPGPEGPLEVAQALADEEPGLAARVLETYLASQYPVFASDTVPGAATPSFQPADLAVLNRIPLLWARAGEVDRARRATAVLAGQEPVAATVARRFGRELGDEALPTTWPHAPFVVDSALLHMVSEARREAARAAARGG